MKVEAAAICAGGKPLILGGNTGVLFPLGGKFEADLDDNIQALIYLVGLLYCFAGVALGADAFMGAIEKITSKKHRKYDKNLKKMITVDVWNATVANLTLMALGSSAPEILLSVIELFANKMHSGDLGPSTIVGSAAFNLMMIIAVCVVAIPSPEFRRIDQLPVFAVTGVFSILAYAWLLVILMFISPDVVEVWEGVMTFMFFPMLCVIAYLADIGFFHKMFNMPWDHRNQLVLSTDTTPAEMDRMMLMVRNKYGEGADDNMEALLDLEFAPKKSRAAHRMGSLHQLTAGKKMASRNSVVGPECLSPGVAGELEKSQERRKSDCEKRSCVQFACENYMVKESSAKVDIRLIRDNNLEKEVSVRVYTEEGTAKQTEDFEALDQVVTFGKNETQQTVTIKIVEDDVWENAEKFYVKLQAKDENVDIGEIKECTVVIIDDDHPGCLKFEQEEINVEESPEAREHMVKVLRTKGTTGTITCKYHTEDGSALAGRDYEECNDTLEFKPHQACAQFSLKIKPKGRYDTQEQFRVVIDHASAGAEFDKTTDGKEDCCILTVNILSNAQHRGKVTSMMQKIDTRKEMFAIGSESWKQKLIEAVYVNGSREEQAHAARTDWVCHVLLLPWKLLVALLIPPTGIAGGWACFCCSLVVIGVMTAAIGDLASLLGCSRDLDDAITAITIVAIGTSLPDTFASKTAAEQDPTADASIGNVTGSNSVNVFLGLGLPWMIASIYWQLVDTDVTNVDDPWIVRGTTAGWLEDYPAILRDYPGKFVVPRGTLGPSVAVFTICACLVLLTLVARRALVGAELGGPVKSKYATAVFFVFLWLVYIGTSIIIANSS